MTLSNNPPPLEAHSLHIEELFETAKQFLDGEPIGSQAQADDIGKLLSQIRQAEKGAEEQRKIEKKPHDDAGKAVQAAWKPLIDKCQMASDACKKALVPWLEKIEAENRARAEAARKEAEEAARRAREVAESARGDDLAGQTAARVLAEQAEAAQKAANRADKERANVAGEGRSIGFRTAYIADILDLTAFARWAWVNRPNDMKAALQVIADREATGPKNIPGLNITEERKVA